MPAVNVVEVCPRDGLQNERTALQAAVRAELVLRSLAAGSERVEAVSFVNEQRVPQMAQPETVVELVRSAASGGSLAGLVLNPGGLQRALATPVDEVNVVVPCTDTMSLKNQGRSTAALVDEAQRMITEARGAGRFVTLTVAVAFGCPFEGDVPADRVRRVLADLVTSRPDEIALADTIGVGVPAQVRELAGVAADEAPGVPLRFHFHNTRNTGYANASAAVDAGVTTLDASAGGFGGCPFAPAATGNIATEDLVYLLERSGHETGVDADLVGANAAWLGSLLGVEPTAQTGRAGPFPPRETAGRW